MKKRKLDFKGSEYFITPGKISEIETEATFVLVVVEVDLTTAGVIRVSLTITQ